MASRAIMLTASAAGEFQNSAAGVAIEGIGIIGAVTLAA
jgi:hypothetical protein